jgi:hypothetical protein
LIQILEQNPDHFPAFVSLAPSPALLHARFLELDVMRAKLGRARPISETELSFLGTFHLRFRKAVDDAHAESPDDTQVAAGGDTEPDDPSPAADDGDSTPEPESEEPAGRDEPTQPQGSKRDAKATSKKAKKTASDEDDIPTKEIHAAAAQDTEDSEPEEMEEIAEDADDDIDDEAPAREAPEAATTKISDALADNNHVEILRHLYREVTRIAEGVWSNEVTPAPLIWEQVTASEWYELNFSRLGLQPLSAFYDVAAKIEEKTREGIDKKQLQELLKESNFARTLLQLRDMFQANDI